MDIELLSEINKQIANIGGITQVADEEVMSILTIIAKNYIRDRSLIWWWESLASSHVVIEYGDGYSWPIIKKLIPALNQMVYIFVTDDEPEPWIAFKGTLESIGRLLRELWRFEYFITSEFFEWLIFDTHHNTLIVSGVIENAAEEYLIRKVGTFGDIL